MLPARRIEDATNVSMAKSWIPYHVRNESRSGILRGSMSRRMSKEEALQSAYYANTSADYDSMHLNRKDEQYFALAFLTGMLDYLEARSVLEIGAGTGRCLTYIKAARGSIQVCGIEPVDELRAIARSKGLSAQEMRAGNALNLEFEDNHFDVVCAFAVLHHVKHPDRVIDEMLRVAKKAIFISDANNFGQGSWMSRSAKQLLNAARLWPIANLIKTHGRGYSITNGDGLAYSYSIFSDYARIKERCRSVHLLNTGVANPNLYRTAGHLALLGIKSQ